jgi:hypothetical protein
MANLFGLCISYRKVYQKILKKFNIKIAFTTDNITEKLLTTKQKQERNKYDKSGIYQLTCPTCDKKYIGQDAPPPQVVKKTSIVCVLSCSMTADSLLE